MLFVNYNFRTIFLAKQCKLCEIHASGSDHNSNLLHITKGNKEITLSLDRGYVVVYTDGSCLNNGKPDAKAGIGVWFGANNPL